MIYRSPKLLALANKCPECMGCGKFNAGDVVAAHSNQIKDGKGTGHKAHDYRVAFICYGCHTEIDSGSTSRAETEQKWERAHRKTIGWLFENGHLKVV